jgi:superfamily II DNA/RNA helicase
MPNWVLEAIPAETADDAREEASQARLQFALDVVGEELAEAKLRFAGEAYELAVFEALDDTESEQELRRASAAAFEVLRVLPRPSDPMIAARWLVRLSTLAVLGDRQADVARTLTEEPWDVLPHVDGDWGTRTEAAIMEVWLLLFRKRGWEDLDAVEAQVVALRNAQDEFEGAFLSDSSQPRANAWRLVTLYHLAHAAEIAARFAAEGAVDGHYDIRQQLEAQFDRALRACARGELIELDPLVRLLARTAQQLVENSIWTVTRAVNSRVSEFVRSIVRRGRARPLFEVLPPQRHALREKGLLGSSSRAVVVSLPTSSGKTLIAQFRMLQALNQFERDQGWVAYLVPTRALVNQVTRRLRRDFGPLGISVERVSPALEVDGLEADLLREQDEAARFRVLVTTPEKLDLLLRGGWEGEIGRPLTLAVVDEAHNLMQEGRGIRLELLLATINRECRHAQFLLLTPFVDNARAVARWLDPESYDDVQLEVEWSPNDRAVVLSRPVAGESRGDFSLELEPVHTTRNTLFSRGRFALPGNRPLGLSKSAVQTSPGKLAIATVEALKDRGPAIVLAQQIRHTWSLARALAENRNLPAEVPAETELVRNYLAEELGEAFPLVGYLDVGIGVHHAGLSDDARALIEWLFEQGRLDVLAATTTIAQGVNFPVATVVLASHQYPYGQDMPAEDFWNLAGRTGRVDQGDVGIVALAANTEQRAQVLTTFVNRNVAALASTLIRMVASAQQAIADEELHRLSYMPEWSAFLQYLAHSYHQIGDADRFATEVEQVLRGAFGYQELRRSEPELAQSLLNAVEDYAERLAGKPLGLVDATGFSWESVSSTLARLGEVGIDAGAWDRRSLFAEPGGDLRKMMGVLLQVPELRANLEFVIGGTEVTGSLLAEITSEWVQGRRLTEIAAEHFTRESASPEVAMTDCCRVIYGKLAPTVSWGLSALQSLTLGESLDDLSEADQRAVRNLPSRVFYGVDSDDAIAMRLLGVPRLAAEPLAPELQSVREGGSIPAIRRELADADIGAWTRALGEKGQLYRSIWRVLEDIDITPGSGI